jgi:hypothetical protein
MRRDGEPEEAPPLFLPPYVGQQSRGFVARRHSPKPLLNCCRAATFVSLIPELADLRLNRLRRVSEFDAKLVVKPPRESGNALTTRALVVSRQQSLIAIWRRLFVRSPLPPSHDAAEKLPRLFLAEVANRCAIGCADTGFDFRRALSALFHSLASVFR